MMENEKMKKCPYCAEMIKAEAIKCRYCGSDLTRKNFGLDFLSTPGYWHRVNEGKKVAGVCTGIARQLDAPILILPLRIFFILTTIFYGFGLILYIILWIMMPPPPEELRRREPSTGRPSTPESGDAPFSEAAEEPDVSGGAISIHDDDEREDTAPSEEENGEPPPAPGEAKPEEEDDRTTGMQFSTMTALVVLGGLVGLMHFYRVLIAGMVGVTVSNWFMGLLFCTAAALVFITKRQFDAHPAPAACPGE